MTFYILSTDWAREKKREPSAASVWDTKITSLFWVPGKGGGMATYNVNGREWLTTTMSNKESQPFDVVSLKSNAGSCSLSFRFWSGSDTPLLQIQVNCRSLRMSTIAVIQYVCVSSWIGQSRHRERESKDVDIGGDRNRDKLNDSIDTI